MIPKRKDPPTKKGKEKVGSSSSRRRPVETNVDDEGRKRGNFDRLSLLQNGESHSFLWLAKGRGKPHLAYPLLVKEFLANFNHAIEEPEADHRYTTWVRGKWIRFSLAVIANYYGLIANEIKPIPVDFDMTHVTQFLCGRADAWPLASPKFLHNQLTENMRIFHIFVCHNIDPTSHRTDFKESRAQFLYHLASGHKIELEDHIF
ncbi:Uncharacterized protein Adt_21859 [Abeliophyllum distichum]|uniref:Putative plant transposon protein domain-containing protein n=1 Tax=Abeliophyllum distichum TaxID=126358 RepID=A0ABD1T0Z3_9LAMI